MSDKEKQDKLDSCKRKLRFNENIEINDLVDVIYNLFWINITNTKFEYILKDGTIKLVQQTTGTSKSIEDCYKIASYYLPGITYTQVREAVQSLYDHAILYYWFCNTVRKVLHNVVYRHIRLEKSKLAKLLKDHNYVKN